VVIKEGGGNGRHRRFKRLDLGDRKMQIINITDKIKKSGLHGDKMETGPLFSPQLADKDDKYTNSRLSDGRQPLREDFDPEIIEYPLPVWLGTGLRVLK
jgi:hypothetical protein